MTRHGLATITDPTAFRSRDPSSASAAAAVVVEANRPMLIEIQVCLVFPAPRRRDQRRMPRPALPHRSPQHPLQHALQLSPHLSAWPPTWRPRTCGSVL